MQGTVSSSVAKGSFVIFASFVTFVVTTVFVFYGSFALASSRRVAAVVFNSAIHARNTSGATNG